MFQDTWRPCALRVSHGDQVDQLQGPSKPVIQLIKPTKTHRSSKLPDIHNYSKKLHLFLVKSSRKYELVKDKYNIQFSLYCFRGWAWQGISRGDLVTALLARWSLCKLVVIILQISMTLVVFFWCTKVINIWMRWILLSQTSRVVYSTEWCVVSLVTISPDWPFLQIKGGDRLS